MRSGTLNELFDKSTLNKAKNIAKKYSIVISPDSNLGFIGTSIELPTVLTDSKIEEQCCRDIHEALVIAVATMLECGQKLPLPASEKRRNFQVNVRLTAEEKSRLIKSSNDLGFKGVSDFVRYVALKAIRSER